jgi:hypothetical protein
MCVATYFKHKACGCIWAEITAQCFPGGSFRTCPDFGGGLTHHDPAYVSTLSRPCPVHQRMGNYDRDFTRRVVKITNGVKWGSGPGKNDIGISIPCIIL